MDKVADFSSVVFKEFPMAKVLRLKERKGIIKRLMKNVSADVGEGLRQGEVNEEALAEIMKGWGENAGIQLQFRV